MSDIGSAELSTSASSAPDAELLRWPEGLRPFDPSDNDIHRDPYAHYAWMRTHAPVLRARGMHFVALYADVVSALRDPATFSSQVIDPARLPFLILFDPPEHTRLRDAVSKAFSPGAIAALNEFITARCELYWERYLRQGGGEAYRAFASPLALETIGYIIGIPETEAHFLRQWTRDAQDYFGRVARRAAGSPNDASGVASMLMRFRAALASALARGDDTVAGNIARLAQHGTLTEEEAAHMCVLLLLAGSETTTISMLNGLLVLCEQPQLLARLRGDAAAVQKFCDELVRYKTPAHRLSRVVTRPVRIAGCHLPAGAEVRLLVACANRDPAQFPDPDTFDMDRNNLRSLAFGNGVHACLGMFLARSELRIAFSVVARRTARIEFDAANPIEYCSGGSMGVSGPLTATLKLEALH